MRQITISEFEDDPMKYLEEVHASGELVQILKDGVAIGNLCPIQSDDR